MTFEGKIATGYCREKSGSLSRGAVVSHRLGE